MIPVLIAPGYNRFDLLERMLRSVDVPVDRTLVLDNARTGYALPAEFDLEGGILERLGDAHVLTPPFASLGYPGSINFGIAQTPDAPWWLWASNDLVFGAGDLAWIAALMDGYAGPRLVTRDFAWGAVNAACVETVGLFDEWSFWPLYFDDQDYLRRCKLGGVDVQLYAGKVAHGADGHLNSVTIRTDEAAALANARSWAENESAYIGKWGGRIGHETYSLPWGNLPLWATRPSPAGRTARAW